MPKTVISMQANALFLMILLYASNVYSVTLDEIHTTLLNLSSRIDQVEQFAKAAYAKTTEISDSMRKRQEMENALLKTTTGASSPEELVQKFQQAKTSATAAVNAPEDETNNAPDNQAATNSDNFYLNSSK